MFVVALHIGVGSVSTKAGSRSNTAFARKRRRDEIDLITRALGAATAELAHSNNVASDEKCGADGALSSDYFRALRAAEAAVRILEDDPMTNAGRGGSIIDVREQNCCNLEAGVSMAAPPGAGSAGPLGSKQVAGVAGIVSSCPGVFESDDLRTEDLEDRPIVPRNPVAVASLLLREFVALPPLSGGRARPCFLAGDGVTQWASDEVRSAKLSFVPSGWHVTAEAVAAADYWRRVAGIPVVSTRPGGDPLSLSRGAKRGYGDVDADGDDATIQQLNCRKIGRTSSSATEAPTSSAPRGERTKLGLEFVAMADTDLKPVLELYLGILPGSRETVLVLLDRVVRPAFANLVSNVSRQYRAARVGRSLVDEFDLRLAVESVIELLQVLGANKNISSRTEDARHGFLSLLIGQPSGNRVESGIPSSRMQAGTGADVIADDTALGRLPEMESVPDFSTVGAIVLDARGVMVSVSSSGGIPLAQAGRLGPAAIPGCCNWADTMCNVTAAATCSGEGERLIQEQLARTIVTAELRRVSSRTDTQDDSRPAVPALGILQDCLEGRETFSRHGLLAGSLSLRRNADGTAELSWAHSAPSFSLGFATNATVTRDEKLDAAMSEFHGGVQTEVILSSFDKEAAEICKRVILTK